MARSPRARASARSNGNGHTVAAEPARASSPVALGATAMVSDSVLGPAQVSVSYDSMTNLLTGMGSTIDRLRSSAYGFTPLPPDQLDAAYRGDWIARKAVDIPVDDATREWRAWQAEDKAIELLEETERRLDLKRKLNRALKLERLFGGGLLVIGVRNERDGLSPLDVETIGKDDLQYLHVLSRHECQIDQMSVVKDVMSPFYGEPEYFTITTDAGRQQRIHASRCVRLSGRQRLFSNASLMASEYWGDSVLDAIDYAIKASGLVTNGVAQMVADSKLDIIGIPGLTDKIKSAIYKEKLTERWAYANAHKSILNALILDQGEEWQRIQTSFASLPDVLKMYLLIAAAAADVPATRFLSQSAVGLNATGESDTRNYYDMVKAGQINELQPKLSTLDEILIRSALGTRDPQIHYTWNPLWQMTDEQKAQLAESKAKVFQIDQTSGLIPITALAKARINQLIEDSVYPGLEAALEEAEKEGDGVDDHIGRLKEQEELALEQQQTMAEAAKMSLEQGAAPGAKPPPGKKPNGSAQAATDASRRAVLGDYDPDQPRDDIGRWTPVLGPEDQQFAGQTQTTYHGTARKNAAQIMREGLTLGNPRTSGYANAENLYEDERGRSVFFTNDLDRAKGYAEHHGDGVVLEIHIPAAALIEGRREGNPTIERDDFDDYESFMSSKPIPPEWIKGVVWPKSGKAATKDSQAYKVVYLVVFGDKEIRDAQPRPLYVRRDVLNPADLVAWAKSQGLPDVVPDMHVTILYSKRPVEWTKMGEEYGSNQEEDGSLVIRPGGPRLIEQFGRAVVLRFVSNMLQWRHENMVRAGASHDYPEYAPHITLFWADEEGGVYDEYDVDKIEPYRGRIVLGPEIFEPIKEDWQPPSAKDSWAQDYDPDQPRDDRGRWTETGVDGLAEDNGADPQLEVPFMLLRLGSPGGGLAGRNAGNIESVAEHLVRTSDFEAPSSAGGVGDTISVWAVTLHEQPAKYQRYNQGGRVTGSDVGRTVKKWSNGQASVSYSFPENSRAYSTQLVRRVPVSALLDDLRQRGYSSPDEAGTLITAQLLRDIAKRRVKDSSDRLFESRDFNPYHDPETGRFTFGPEGVGSSGSGAAFRSAMVHAPKDRKDWPQHVRGLRVPPAWTNVQIASDPNADLVVTGKDVKGRTQYLYSAKYTEGRQAAKFERIRELSEKFESVMRENDRNRRSEDGKTKSLADATALIAHTGIRPGSEGDTHADKQAYGATTLEGRHVHVTPGGKVSLRFVGKKGVDLNVPIKDAALAAMVRERAEAAGRRGQLFPEINQGSLLAYVSSLDGGGFKTKDLRTALGTSYAYELVQAVKRPPKDAKSYKKAVMGIAKAVAERLGNTAAVALRSYIDPTVFGGWRQAVA